MEMVTLKKPSRLTNKTSSDLPVSSINYITIPDSKFSEHDDSIENFIFLQIISSEFNLNLDTISCDLMDNQHISINSPSTPVSTEELNNETFVSLKRPIPDSMDYCEGELKKKKVSSFDCDENGLNERMIDSSSTELESNELNESTDTRDNSVQDNFCLDINQITDTIEEVVSQDVFNSHEPTPSNSIQIEPSLLVDETVWIPELNREEKEDPIVIPKFKNCRKIGRKHLAKIHQEQELDQTTKIAIKNERKRIERINAQESIYNSMFHNVSKHKSKPRLILDIDKETKRVRVEVNSSLVGELKPHQVEGVKFMYNSIVENVDKLKGADEGSSCILAHCMGSGKSLEVITLIHTLLSNHLTNKHIKTILITVPGSNIWTWNHEFDKWIGIRGLETFKVYQIRVEHGVSQERIELLDEWRKTGGVLLIGHCVLERLLNKCNQQIAFGNPDIVVVDEGHLIKTQNSQMHRVIENIITKRKIFVTGTPIQNNLDEFYNMVELLKPGLLGSSKEFANRFRNPIENGFKCDSNDEDVSVMEKQIDVLNELTAGFIHRCGPETLDLYLQPKVEYAIYIRPTKLIVDMYKCYLNNCVDNNHLFKESFNLRFCVNHPAIFQLRDEIRSSKSTKINNVDKPSGTSNVSEIHEIDQVWYKQFIKADDWKNIELSGKFVLLFKILKECVTTDEKLVVVSQSTETLDLIEKCLKFSLGWELNQNYIRIFSRNNNSRRPKEIWKFNNIYDKTLRLLLTTTKGTAIGYNLIGANRVIIFDVSWNTFDDTQVISRLYRFGQTKPVYVYRFITKDTIEELIFQKQIGKLKMISSIVDKKLIKGSLKNFGETEFYKMRPKEDYESSILEVPKDNLLADILLNESSEILNCYEINCFLERASNQEKSVEELKKLWADYKMTKSQRMNKENETSSNVSASPLVNTDSNSSLFIVKIPRFSSKVLKSKPTHNAPLSQKKALQLNQWYSSQLHFTPFVFNPRGNRTYLKSHEASINVPSTRNNFSIETV